jgi:hypothetical protein
MPLIVSSLENELIVEFTTPNPEKKISDHAKALGEAYNNYCMSATTAYGGMLTVNGLSSFISTFTSVMLIPIPTLFNYCLAIESACISYWASSSFSLLIGIPPGFINQSQIIISPPVSQTISSPINSALSLGGTTPNAAAKIISSAMNIGTKTVTTTHFGVLISGNPSSIGPTPIL